MPGEENVFFGRNVLKEALSVKAAISEIYYETPAAKKFVESLHLVKTQNIPLKMGIPGETKNQSHQGVAFSTSHSFYQKFTPEAVRKVPFVVLCNHVEDVQNFGSIARCAAGFGAKLIIHEEKNSAALTGAAMKASAGLAFRITFMKVSNLVFSLKELSTAGFNIVGLDVDKQSISIFDWVPSFPVAVVLGSEGSGMSTEVKHRCQTLIRIPMEKTAESLNVSHAAAIAFNWVYRGAIR